MRVGTEPVGVARADFVIRRMYQISLCVRLSGDLIGWSADHCCPMRASTTSPVHASSAVDALVTRSGITLVVMFSGDHSTIGSSATGMSLIAEGETADQNHNRKDKASHRHHRFFHGTRRETGI